MKQLKLFSDASVNPQSKMGFGAYILVSTTECSPEVLQKQIRVKRFINTSSTRLELETLLWALKEIPTSPKSITIYTDSQNIITLPTRRERFERNSYRSKKNILIKNHRLYQEFFQITDSLAYTLIKLKGHQANQYKTEPEKIFSLVDKAARKALKNDAK